MNERIRAREIRVVGDDGEQFGVMSARDALALAAEKELDLVEISPNATPPVCKIMDYGKFKYEKTKKDKENKKKQKMSLLKKLELNLILTSMIKKQKFLKLKNL